MIGAHGRVPVFAREGLEISTQTMWDQEDALADLLEPSYVKLLAYVMGDDIIGADETHWRLMQPRQQQEVVGLVPDHPRRRLVHARAEPLR